MLSDTDRTKKFNAYFARIGAGEDAVTAFEAATGIPVANLKNILTRYATKLPIIKVTIKDIPSADIRNLRISDQAQAYVLNASLLKTCVDKNQGVDILNQLRALRQAQVAPEQGLRLALARAEILFGDPKWAYDDLSRHAAEDENSFEAHYLSGRALMLEAHKMKEQAQFALIDQARDQFLKAYSLQKLDAPNLYYLAQSLAIDGASTNVLNAASGARTLAPGVSEYAIYEALVDLDAEQRDKAIAALTPLASSPHNQQQSARVRSAIEAIKAGKPTSDVLRLLNAVE